MKKYILLSCALAAVTMSSCSDDATEAITENQGAPVAFDSYLSRTRATDLTTTASIQAAGAGFGVYAYEQGTLKVVDYTNSFVAPNFFSNQHVSYNGSTWQYTNIKYWPNNTGAMLSFYAYAPYKEDITTDVASNPRLILNGDYNGPALQYKMPDALSDGMDLCWGQEYGKTLAPVDQPKPAVGDKIKFNFKHALSRLGFNIQVFNDEATDGTGHSDDAANAIANGTSIRVQSLKLVGNFATSGILSLYDGKWDAPIANTAEYELNGVLNPTVKDMKLDEATTEIPLFENEDTYVLMIPGAKFKIQITYDVVTKDENLPNKESVVRNVITSEGDYFEAQAGVATDYHLNIGMTTVKFEASLVEWNEPTDNKEVDLPNNN